MKAFIRQGGFGAALLAAWSLGAADPEPAETTYTAYAEKPSLVLDLRTQTEKKLTGSVSIDYSSVGWEKAAIDEGGAVTLTVTPEGGETLTIASGLTGCATFSWTPTSVDYNKVYRFNHYVIKDNVTNTLETLEGLVSFLEAADIERRQVFAEGSATCAIANDQTNPWAAGATTADGITAPSGSSTFAFNPIYGGTLSFGYRLAGGTLEVYVDGVLAATLAAADDWTLSPEIAVSGQGAHSIEVRAATGADAQAAIRQAVWSETDGETTAFAASAVYALDPTNGVRCVRVQEDILPIVYSPTNFTGLSETAAATAARVRAVQLTGDEAEGIESWTNAVNEVAGTSRILVDAATMESSVVWSVKIGVWKLVFDILANGEVVRTEYAIFDARRLKKGLVLILK